MGKLLLAAIAAVVLVVALMVAGGAATTLAVDTVKDGNFGGGENIVLKDGATLTVNGDLTVDKKFSCKNGPLALVVVGNANITGTLECQLDTLAQTGAANGITLVVSGSVTFGKDANIISNGHVQIVSDAKNLLTTQDEIDAAYDEAGMPTGSGPRIGPFIGGGNASVTPTSGVGGSTDTKTSITENGVLFIQTAHAQVPTDKNGNPVQNIIISGHWIIGDGGNPPSGLQVPKPPKGVHKIILNFNFGAGGHVGLHDFHLVGPAGEDGKSDADGKNCNAIGADGKNAMRFRVDAGSIDINNFRIELGNGGMGGAAVTAKTCDPGVAKGGKGGEAGNFKMTAEEGITIASMHIVPGVGGVGGNADAYGKDGEDGCPGKKGGDATATGGQGGDNKKELSADGNVEGIGNITMDEVTGGQGGDATAQPGKGGNGVGCNCNGGVGGKATATAGNGGNASIKVAKGASATDAKGGDGGDADATGGNGGNGGQCPLAPNGGNGGKGGDATSKEGKGGTGTTASGDDGTVKNEKGGDGGNGGDGCGPGGGGKGGKGRTPGTDGKPGNLKCPEEEKKTSVTTPPTTGGDHVTTGGGSETGGGTTGGGQTTGTIEVISYNGKYLPVSQLIIENEVGCGADHWHAATGVVVATDGTKVSDPGPQCGFGKVKDKPIMRVSTPAANAATNNAASISVSQSSFTFVHNIGQTQCPEPIGNVAISGNGAASWRVTTALPSWLTAQQSGSVPGNLNLMFNCQLGSYVTQALSGNVGVELLDKDGKSTGAKATIAVKGQVNAQQ